MYYTNEFCELLSHSLYYYCCGIDITPITAFAERCPLYVYVDIIKYGNGNFNEETDILCNRLQTTGFQLIEKKEIKFGKRALLTQWRRPQSKPFFMLYVGDDAQKVYSSIYEVLPDNVLTSIQPKCICNYKYEFVYIEKRTEYILGHCYNMDEYRKIAEYDYLGDYGGTKVPLYKRMY